MLDTGATDPMIQETLLSAAPPPDRQSRQSTSVALGAGIAVGTGIEESLLEQGPDAFLLLTADGTIAFVNSAAERLFGYPREQLLGVEHTILLSEDERGGFLRVFGRLGRGSAAGRRPFAAAGRRRDGSELSLEITCSLVTVDGGPAMAVAVRDGQPPGGHRLGPPAGGLAARCHAGNHRRRDCGGLQRRPDHRGQRPVPQVVGHAAGADRGGGPDGAGHLHLPASWRIRTTSCRRSRSSTPTGESRATTCWSSRTAAPWSSTPGRRRSRT